MSYRFSKIAVQLGCIALLGGPIAASAVAGDQGIINQRNPLEATERFYLHPAHLYLSGQAPSERGERPTVLAKHTARDKPAREVRQSAHPSPVDYHAQKHEVGQSLVHSRVQ